MMKTKTKYLFTDQGECVDYETGEIVNYNEITKSKQLKINEEYHKMQEEFKQNTGINSDWVLVKYKSKKYICIPIKQNFTFGKVFRTAVQDLMENDRPSNFAIIFIGILEPYIHFPTNEIMYHSKSPTLKELEQILGMGKSKLYDVLNELEEKEVIKRVKRSGNTIIYFNPFLYCSGLYIHPDTYLLFKDSKYNNHVDTLIKNEEEVEIEMGV